MGLGTDSPIREEYVGVSRARISVPAPAPRGLPISSMDSLKSNSTSWLHLFVDAMTERDPYKRLALIRELRRVPRESEVEDASGVVHREGPLRRRPTKIKSTSRR